MAERPLTVLCIASYEKGQEFMRECKRQGCRVLLLTVEHLADADWPHEAIDAVFYGSQAPRDDLIKGVSYMARTERIDRIVPLDDFDVETAALLREHLRIPGMGDTTARHFRDKLAMRVKARDHGIRVPDFVHVLNHDAIREYTERVPPPWLIKPRSQASAIGIKRLDSADELWGLIEALGDRQPFYVLERYISGDIYHVDSVVWDRAVQFAAVHRYGRPPMDVAHQGGISTSRTLPKGTDEVRALEALNRRIIDTLGLVRGVTHTEFVQDRNSGDFAFIETAARVGGAYTAELVEAASGLNLWREWARIEIAGEDGAYVLPEHRAGYAGIILSLARQEAPDTSAYDDPEIVARIKKKHHAVLIVASTDPARIERLLEDYTRRFADDFLATLPLPERPTS